MQWSVDASEITVSKHEVGRGSFGVVRLASWRHTQVAVKVLFQDAQAEDRELFEREVKIMATLHHPHIVQFLGYARIPSLALILEYFPEGAVDPWVVREKPSHRRSLSLCVDMALAIEYMHSRKPTLVIHRDVKPANFMVTQSKRVKLGDFGVARSPRGRIRSALKRSSSGNLDDSVHSLEFVPVTDDSDTEDKIVDLTSNCGTARFMAPEVSSVLSKSRYSCKADIFSLALVYYFVWERALPNLRNRYTATAYREAMAEGERPAFVRTPKPIRALIESMWDLRAPRRPSACQVLEYLGRVDVESRLFMELAPAPHCCHQ